MIPGGGAAEAGVEDVGAEGSHQETTCLSRSSAISRSWVTVSARSASSSLSRRLVELGQDLRGGASGRPDEEHPVEPLLVCRVALGEGPRRLGVGRVHPGLLPGAGRRVVVRAGGPLPDPRVPRQRHRQLVLGEVSGSGTGGGLETRPPGIRATVADGGHPPGDRQTGSQLLVEGRLAARR